MGGTERQIIPTVKVKGLVDSHYIHTHTGVGGDCFIFPRVIDQCFQQES